MDVTDAYYLEALDSVMDKQMGESATGNGGEDYALHGSVEINAVPVDCSEPAPQVANGSGQVMKFNNGSPLQESGTPKVLPSGESFAVQCALCFKWRIVPSAEKYEEIRANIMDNPFICETANEWREAISCSDPGDVDQDDTRIWAIDKPSISKPPPGWKRLLRIRGGQSKRFADVYYIAPCGKRLRSTVEVARYLEMNSETAQNVDLSLFSFCSPKPMGSPSQLMQKDEMKQDTKPKIHNKNEGSNGKSVVAEATPGKKRGRLQK